MDKKPTKPMMPKDKMASMMAAAGKGKANPDYSSSDLAKELGKRQRKRKLTAE